MRILNGGVTKHAEQRQRALASQSSTTKRKVLRNRYPKEGRHKFFGDLSFESFSRKFFYLKLLLAIAMCGLFTVLLNSPTVKYDNHQTHPISRQHRSTTLQMQESERPDTGYMSYLAIDWPKVSRAIAMVDKTSKNLHVGILNFNREETEIWRTHLPDADLLDIKLDHVNSSITWEDLYPEWIDEEEESKVPTCPHFPQPNVPEGFQYDLVVVKLPCSILANWSRDVPRLHLQLAAAHAAAFSSETHSPAHVLVISKCFPMPNLFKCRNLVTREGSAWLYKPDVTELQEYLRLPVGSCKLALPLKAAEESQAQTPRREAYATILHSENVYVCGAIVAAQSIRLAGSTRDLIILVDETISSHHRSGLEVVGWKIITIQKIRYPKAQQDAYNEWNYSKFWLWTLTDYDKIIFVDADLLILRNIDFLFSMPEISATGNNGSRFNSGLMVIEPSNCTFQLLMDHIHEIESYNGGDQGYLNEIFASWHRLPRQMNYMKHFWVGDTNETKEKKTHLYGANPPILYVIHYVGSMKPWLCFRDYDCNWNVDVLHEFASDAAHATWWKVQNTMPAYLQSFCLLNEKQKALLQWDIAQARKGNYSDGHYKTKISDPRLSICIEKDCKRKKIRKIGTERNRYSTSYTRIIRDFYR